MEKELLRLLLQYDFYNNNKNRIAKEMFSKSLEDIYKLIVDLHEKYSRDLSITEIKELYKVNHPTITKTAWDNLCIVLDDLPKEINDDVATEILKKAWIVECGRRLAEAGIQIVNGKEIETTQITKIIEEINTGRVSECIELENVTDELEEILAAIDTTTRWQYNIPDLHKVAKGVGPGIFTGVFARVEVGKSAFGVSLCAAPNGFADQGALIHFYCNEESAVRTKARAVMSYTGMNLLELQTNLEQAKKIYFKVRDRLKFYNVKGFTIEDVKGVLHKHKPDIVIFDQLDKFEISGTFARKDEKLGALYIKTRNILDEEQCAGIALSQASADSEGKAYMSSADMAEARTAKAAELDVLIGIGKSPVHDDMTRVLNLVKSKITGSHTDVICRLQPDISRYIA